MFYAMEPDEKQILELKKTILWLCFIGISGRHGKMSKIIRVQKFQNIKMMF